MWIDKIKSNLLNLYPELGHFPSFQKLPQLITAKINPGTQRVLRYVLPVIALLFIIFFGLALGKSISNLFLQDKISITAPEQITKTPVIEYQSAVEPIKQEIEKFSLSVPDPVLPTLDDNLSLEEIKK